MNFLARAKLLWGMWGVWDRAVAQTKESGVNAKSLFASKVFWFNVIAGLIGFAQSQGLFELIPAPYGEAALVVGNILLRLVTTQPVKVLPSS